MKLQLFFIAVVLCTSPFIWILPKTWRGKIMMLATLIVWLYVSAWSLLILILITVLQWLLWQPYFKEYKRLRLMLSILLPLLPLIIYKIGHKTNDWIIPLGLSYYAFRQMHVAFEYYKGQLTRLTLEEYFQYLLFLPVILIGPIHRIEQMQRSLRRMKWQPAVFSNGLERILYGVVKIVFFGNYLFTYKFHEWADNSNIILLKDYLKLMAFTGNAYAQFSGFSDLAIGMGLLWGIKVIENFNYPFMATNMQDFWTRWHISLSSWCRDYVFQPIMALSRNRWFALITAMLVLALWHEISWRYIFWGIFHSLLILLTIITRKNFPAFSRYINHDYFGRWLGRLWVVHAFAFSCIFLIIKQPSILGINLNLLFK